MNIEIRNTHDLIPYVNNPRKNDGPAVDKVASSIKQFGFKVPIIIDSQNEIVAGHTRLKAAKKLGLDEVPCIIADDLTPAQIKAFRIADNRVAAESEWDFDLLEIELEGLDGFSVEDLGFDVGEIPETFGPDGFGEDFTLPDGDKAPFQQMTFTLADDQAETVKSAIDKAKQENNVDTYGNENSNGNALYRVVLEWAEQRI